MNDDIDPELGATAIVVREAIQHEFRRIRDETALGAIPAAERVMPREKIRRRRLNIAAVGAVVMALAAGVLWARREHPGDDRTDLHTVITTPEPPNSDAYFLPRHTPVGYELDSMSEGGGISTSLMTAWWRIYYNNRTDQIIDVLTNHPDTTGLPSGGTGVSRVSIAGQDAVVQHVDGMTTTQITLSLPCGIATVYGRAIDTAALTAAAQTLRCTDAVTRSAAALDPPLGFALAYDAPLPTMTASGTAMYLRTDSYRTLSLSFSTGIADLNQLWLLNRYAVKRRVVTGQTRTYTIFESEASVNTNGVASIEPVYSVNFLEAGALVGVGGNGLPLDELIAFAESIERVEHTAFSHAIDAMHESWRKPFYYIPDAVPAGFTVHAVENRQRAQVLLHHAAQNSNYSVSFTLGQSGVDLPGRQSRSVTVNGRTIALIGFSMAAPPPPGQSTPTSSIGLRQAEWNDPGGARVTVTTSGGDEVELALIEIITAMRRADYSEWQTFLKEYS